MITSATITATGRTSDPLDHTAIVRGDPAFNIDATDLLEIGRSPVRWVNLPPPEADPKPNLLGLLRCMWLAPSLLSATYARRPDTYTALTSTCPSCKSVSTAKVCRACGRKRVQVPSVRDWAGAATYCTQWSGQQTASGRLIVPPQQWDAAADMTASLVRDPCTLELEQQSDKLCLISGTWHDAATGLDIPVHCNLDFAPRTGNSLDMTIGSLTLSADADPAAWTTNAYNHGAHIRAALKQALHAAATGDPRSTHVWCICERSEPYITARRRAAPELLAKGQDTLAQLLGAYAQCLKTRTWPAFDATAPGSLNAWSQVYLEPWMTQGSGGGASYFALAAPATPPEP